MPFDVILAAANEYGAAASSKIFGVEILNCGFGTSVDDSVLEQQGTFIARSVLCLHLMIRLKQTRGYRSDETHSPRASAPSAD